MISGQTGLTSTSVLTSSEVSNENKRYKNQSEYFTFDTPTIDRVMKANGNFIAIIC